MRYRQIKNKGAGIKSIAMVTVLIFAGLNASGLQAEIYYWTDENGIKHFSHTPPTDRALRLKTAPEFQPDASVDLTNEKINEENIEDILEQLDQEEQAATPKAAEVKKPLSRQERIQVEKEKLENKIARLEQLPSQAFANTRSKQAIIGRYQYRLQQLLSDPDAYFEGSGY